MQESSSEGKAPTKPVDQHLVRVERVLGTVVSVRGWLRAPALRKRIERNLICISRGVLWEVVVAIEFCVVKIVELKPVCSAILLLSEKYFWEDYY